MLDAQDALILATARQTTQLAGAATLATGLSRVAVSRRIKRLADEGYLLRHGSGTRPTYSPGPNRFWLQTETRVAMEKAGGEFGIWETAFAPLVQGIAANVANIANIAFTEMLNNALDHSQARHVCVALHLHSGRLQMAVMDDGVGVFHKIGKAMGLFDDRLALLELAKGKYTTAAEGHSGMGVFVTSRMLDRFAILSKGLVFAPRQDTEPLHFDWLDTSPYLNGTVVLMDIALDSPRTAQQVYERFFTPDEVGGEAFHTTEIPVRLAQLSSQLISRSQGKWVVERATQFKTVILDFEGVEMVGQAFVDEVLRVFATAHPEVRLVLANTSPAVHQQLRMFAPGFFRAP